MWYKLCRMIIGWIVKFSIVLNYKKTTIITDEELEIMAEYARSSQTESTFLQKLNKNAKKEKEEVKFHASKWYKYIIMATKNFDGNFCGWHIRPFDLKSSDWHQHPKIVINI